MGYKYLTLFIFITSAFCNNSSIQGFSTDSESKEPLIGANIMLDGTSLGAASDENGYYIIKNIPIGTYTLRVMFIGYETLEKEIWVEDSHEYTIDIKLKSSAIELQETRVTAEKRKGKITDAPASMEIVSSRDIKRETTTNMGSYLKGLKGVDFTSSGINNYSISIRGFNSSFNTRVLTLSDGRVANMPALRVINYSVVPQSMDDIDRMEVVLGPATALYGANAHSGVVNIISKSPAHSEGLTMSVSGSNDKRQLRKINGRWAQKLSDSFSIKISGMYLHGYEWPYISEIEHKTHSYPWTGNPYRADDNRDNNPWNANSDTLHWQINNSGDSVRIGNGEPDHGCSNYNFFNQASCIDAGHSWYDWDGDGVAGEDWFNGYDDDGDGLIDEDYFIANEKDDNENGEIDEYIDYSSDVWNDGYDNDGNGYCDKANDYCVDDDEEGNINNAKWAYNMEGENIIIFQGRGDSLINGQPNPWYVPGSVYQSTELKPHLRGNMKYDETLRKYTFDIYIYDYGFDHIPGTDYIDRSGDGEFQLGECISEFGFEEYSSCDRGLDGIPGTGDTGELDGIWQPGDGWIDTNKNGYPDDGIDYYRYGESSHNEHPDTPDQNDFDDVWPPPNGYWDEHDTLLNDGVPKDGYQGDPYVDENNNGKHDGEESDYYDRDNNGIYSHPTGEFDGVFDTGDEIFNYQGDQFYDYGLDGTPSTNDEGENDKVRQSYENYNDDNNDGMYTPPDYMDNFQRVNDVNGDGISDYPDFEVENRKVEFRLDFDPNINVNMTFQGGYSWTKTQQVTGTSRYLADGFEYKYYQLRGRFYNWYSQVYMNQSFSGNTRSYNLGSVIEDRSKNYAFQLQRNDQLDNFNTDIVWGMDYFKTLPSTNGTILNDGPNGYDNDGDNLRLAYDGIDQDGDGRADDRNGWCAEGITTHYKNGRDWKCAEGIDEPDEFDNPESNEYGFYYQTKTELLGTSRFELITAARWDKHDLLEEGLQFAPKVGFIYKPDDKSSFRLTYGKAFNTPNSVALYTDLFIQKIEMFDVYLRGNKDGTPYCHAGDECSNSDNNFSGSIPGYWDTGGDSLIPANSSLSDDYHEMYGEDYFSGYNERTMGAPFFYNVDDTGVPRDMVPLDTSRYLIYIPELNGDGVLYSPLESINIPDVSAIKTEKIQTIELGYKGFIGNRTHISFDYYISYYEDFFSPPTIITPSIILRYDDENKEVTNIADFTWVGLMPINSFQSNPPYGTAWDGIDNDGDWAIWSGDKNNFTEFDCLSQECGFNWTTDDKDNDGDYLDQEAGEWGFVYWHTSDNNNNDTLGYYIYEPDAVIIDENMNISQNVVYTDEDGNTFDVDFNFSDAVGVDEFHPVVGFNEAEIISTGLFGPNGEQLEGPGVAMSPPDLVLSPMNYGKVKMQGVDMGITQLIPEYDLIIDGNISWYGTTEFYNELTKKNDPINAPKWKWNGSIKWNSSMGDLTLNYRHVNEFKWSDGIWAGIIGPYDIFDFHYNYMLTDNLEFNISALNFMDDRHKELIGGAEMGRQIIMRMTSIF